MSVWTETRKLFRQSVVQQPKTIYIKKSPLHGQGVFAKKDCRPGNIIELAPVILLSHAERELLRHTMLFGYYFVIDNPDYAIAMGLGDSSLFNHSNAANAEYMISIENQVITVTACKHIRRGEEITLNYNGRPDDIAPVYFPSGSHGQAKYPELPERRKGERLLYVKDIPGKGRGVFCNRTIPADSLIETSILLVFPGEDYPSISHTLLRDYIFNCEKDQQVTAMALGFGSLYNHALYPNARYQIDHTNRLISYYATENISRHKEVCINYDGSPGSDEWFKARNMSYSHY